MPGGLRDPAPVRVAAVERRLDQRRVGDRPRDPLGLVVVGRPGHLDPPDPGRALAVGDDLERELQQDRVEQARRAAAAPAAPLACSSTVSLVLIWPSTVIRSNEPATARAQRRVGIVDDPASVWTKQSMVAKPGSIIPAPLAWAETVTPPARTRAALRARGRWS